ncbi:MAG TPA: hypothetical protein VGV38_10250 [Pyrinomonadaceae bacterium]|nr:hypothetical protein [Pyrinomonadaceae bacterium]
MDIMLIRPSQMRAFRREAERLFVDDTAAHLRQHYPEHVSGLHEEVLKAMVRGGIARGRGHGLTLRSTLTAFVALMFVVSPNFDEQPTIYEVLNNENLHPDSRLDVLTAMTTDEDWREAAAIYDVDEWVLEEGEDG